MIGRALTLCLCLLTGFVQARQSPTAPAPAPVPSLLRLVSEAQATTTGRKCAIRNSWRDHRMAGASIRVARFRLAEL